MLETVKKYIKNLPDKDFSALYVDYILSSRNRDILLEMDYIKSHNKLDIFKIDKWIDNLTKEALCI